MTVSTSQHPSTQALDIGGLVKSVNDAYLAAYRTGYEAGWDAACKAALAAAGGK